MYNKLNQLSFVIGLFFSIVAVILIITFLTDPSHAKITLYTSVVFLIFGGVMMAIKERQAGADAEGKGKGE